MSLQDLDRMIEDQDNLCLICDIGFDELDTKHVCIDHCHDTGFVRGILCSTCNVAIGLLKDDPRLVAKALDYLETKHAP